MSSVALIIAGVVTVVSIGIILYATQKGVPGNRNTVTSEPGSPNAYTPVMSKELGQFALPPTKLNQVSRFVSSFVDKEVHKETERVRNELNGMYSEKIVAKDNAIKVAEKKFVTMTQDYLKLGKSKKQTETVVRSHAEGRVVVDKDGRLILVNAAAEKVLGKKKEELLGKPIVDIKGKEQVVSYVKEMMHSENEALVQLSEDQVAQKVIRGSNAIIESDSGQTQGMISVLPETYKKNETETYKDEFVASITHELRTPLVCIQKSLDSLLSGGLGVVSPEQKNYLSIAQRNSEKLSSLVNEILDFARIESGTMKLNTTLIPVTELIADIKQDMSTWAKEKKIELLENVSETTLSLEADKTRLGQVLTNLVSNALKFTSAGGKIVLSARYSLPGESILPEDGRTFVRFEVQDTGSGIPSDECKRIFDKFTRGTSQATEGEARTGLGLAIVREIVQKHGGYVWVESEVGKGSNFIFVIPQYPL